MRTKSVSSINQQDRLGIIISILRRCDERRSGQQRIHYGNSVADLMANSRCSYSTSADFGRDCAPHHAQGSWPVVNRVGPYRFIYRWIYCTSNTRALFRHTISFFCAILFRKTGRRITDKSREKCMVALSDFWESGASCFVSGRPSRPVQWGSLFWTGCPTIIFCVGWPALRSPP